MENSPSIVGIAALIGDPARSAMLTTLMCGQALTATELASVANITKQTASSHLYKLTDARLIRVQAQGRHRYYQLAATDVAQALESLMVVAQRTRATKPSVGPRDPVLRKARVCYDHLAGELAVAVYDRCVQLRLVRLTQPDDSPDTLALTREGITFFAKLGIELDGRTSRRPVCRPCLDWSMRRHHLAGRLGQAILAYCYREKWAKKVEGSRIVRFSVAGERAFLHKFSSGGSET